MPLDVGNMWSNPMRVHHIFKQLAASIGDVEVGTSAVLALVTPEYIHYHQILLCIVLRQTHRRIRFGFDVGLGVL